MDLSFDKSKCENYKSNAQKIRVMSEEWIGKNIYCPVCGYSQLISLPNNMPVADFQCKNCGEIFELKSKCGNISRKIPDGAYSTMIERISSTSNPNFFIMGYDKEYSVNNLFVVPKFLFTTKIIEIRKPLSASAKRAGWVGCNILFDQIPIQGRIPIIEDKVVRDKRNVVEDYAKIKALQIDNIEKRSWLFDIMNCVNHIPFNCFSLNDIYRYEDILKKNHPKNNFIRPKIRQQLQILRNKGFIEFLGNGKYIKL